ncbi:MAG: outer membrane beta-barrel protein [Paracoccaceae bacterium]
MTAIAARFLAPLAVVFGLGASPALAEFEIGIYGGLQSAPDSSVTGSDPQNPAFPLGGFTAGWEGNSTAIPPYYGIRATMWRTPTFGWGIEFTHAKVYADGPTLAATGYERFELTDGHNLITLNAYRRWPDAWGMLTPYVGGGVGVAMPHVDIRAPGGAHTFGYQLTGPAARIMAGVQYDISPSWSVFGEYQGSYSANTIDLDGGGEIKTDILTNAVNLGLSFRF